MISGAIGVNTEQLQRAYRASSRFFDIRFVFHTALWLRHSLSRNMSWLQHHSAAHGDVEPCMSLVLLMTYPPRVIGAGSASIHPLLVRDDTNGVKDILSGFPSAMSMRRPL